jgi:hypothetical protein
MVKLTLFFLVFFCFFFSHARSVKTTCGDYEFEVSVSGADSLAGSDRIYHLVVFKKGDPQSKKPIYKSEKGDWFEAMCFKSSKGDVVLFQSYCQGSVCVEDKYGIVDGHDLKVLLKPDLKNISNEKEAKTILGTDVPLISKEKNSFCCDTLIKP